ncbi:MAG: thioesterase family protein [Ignavibacteriaceae bacterium]|jgi:acyl-CoA thioester hydrolase
MPRVKIELPEEFIFKTEIPIRINDINYGGHLGNDAVLSIAHEARLRFLKQHNFTELNAGGAGIIMADAAVQYKAEGFYGDIILVEIAVTDITGVGCDFVYRCTNKNTGIVIAIVKTGIVFYDYDKKKVVSVPERFISVLTEK